MLIIFQHILCQLQVCHNLKEGLRYVTTSSENNWFSHEKEMSKERSTLSERCLTSIKRILHRIHLLMLRKLS